MLPIAVLAGGLATRLGEITQDIPKCMIEVQGRPFIDWQLDLLVNAGYREIVFCVSHKSEIIQEYLMSRPRSVANIVFSHDGKSQLGTGGAIKNALTLLGPEFAVIYGDSYLPIDFADVEVTFRESLALGLMTIYKNTEFLDLSNVIFENGKLIKYQKGHVDPRMNYVDYGLAYYQSEAFLDYAENEQFDLSDLSFRLSESGKLSGFEVKTRFYEIGSIQGIEEFSSYLVRRLK
jgi:MurNAc alpha-1-phosphate uridylyltransferase